MYIEVYGKVPVEFISAVKAILAELYECVIKPPELVEVYIYESTEMKLSRLVREASALGVFVIGDYPVSHEAWAGWPRIHVDYEKCRELDHGVLKALLIHEGVHSVLHGSISSYIITMKRDLVERLGGEALEAFYLASTVVKDIEVHSFLTSRKLSNLVELYYGYTSKSLFNARCSGVIDLLEISKLLSPCVYIKCTPDPVSVLSEDCKALYEKVLAVIFKIAELPGDLSLKVNMLIEELLKVVENKRG